MTCIAVVGALVPGGQTGGAERFYDGVCGALRAAGAEVDLVCEVCDETDQSTLEAGYLKFYALDLARYQGCISTKGPSYALRHPNHVCYLVHTARTFYDMFDDLFPEPWPALERSRRRVHTLDGACLLPPRTRRIFCIGHEVRRRLLRFNNLRAEVLYPGLPFDQPRKGEYDYLFLPGRLHRWKRVDLVLQALALVDRPVRLLIAGTGDQEPRLRELAGSDRRVSFLGWVADDELARLYAGALAVPFVPVREDLGLVALEALRWARPVLTCTDSGEPARFVRDGIDGFVCPPEPARLAACIRLLYDRPDLAREMGRRGRVVVAELSWRRVGETLLAALGF